MLTSAAIDMPGGDRDSERSEHLAVTLRADAQRREHSDGVG
jgi:hypothetical protein